MKPGTLLFTDSGGQVLNRTLSLNYMHVLIWLNDIWYEATWPVVRKTNKDRRTNRWLFREPIATYTPAQLRGMLQYAESMLGTPYMCQGYFFPNRYGKTRGVYCSEFACKVLRAGGVGIPAGAGYTPDKLLKTMKVYDK
jgi:hypothetical protein